MSERHGFSFVKPRRRRRLRLRQRRLLQLNQRGGSGLRRGSPVS